MSPKRKRDGAFVDVLPEPTKPYAVRRQPQAVKFVDDATACREHPGRWRLLIAQHPACYQLADKIRAGKFPAFRPRGEWDVAVRNSRHNPGKPKRSATGDVYVRHIAQAGDVVQGVALDPWEALFRNQDAN